MESTKTKKIKLNQYLTFNLAEELFAVDVAQVREVLELREITRIPRTPAFLRGVLNVRGSVVPVVDLRRKFEMEEVKATVDTSIVVLEVQLEGEEAVLGALVDAVEEVVEIEPEQIEPPPRIGTRLNTEFIRGMGEKEERFIIILDIDRLFSSEELAVVREAEEKMKTAGREQG